MQRWCGKVAVLTGAGAGIGAAIAKDLVEAGMKVVGLDLHKEKMEDNYKKMDTSAGGLFYPRKCDITEDHDVLDSFSWIKQNLGGVDVLVNNAGVFKFTTLTAPGNTDDLRSLLDVNILGLCLCTREAFNCMKERNVAGHIIHINSLAGHYVPITSEMSLNLYPGTKHCITALIEVLRQEMNQLGSRTKITSISPSFVATELILAKMKAEEREAVINHTPHLKPEDVSQGVLFCLGTPEHVQVHELTIRSIGEKM